MVSGDPNYPLVIDLDGTLLRTDSLFETLLDLLRSKPSYLWKLIIAIFTGIPALKSFLAKQSPLDIETWPVNEDFVEYVKNEAKTGRKIILATAANETIASAITARFPFINETVSSNENRNLKGAAKAAALREKFPEGFIYAGDSIADLPVWRASKETILVNANKSLEIHAAGYNSDVKIFRKKPLTPSVIFRCLRLHQWLKNLLVFVPLVLGGKVSDFDVWVASTVGFLALGFVASSTYIINDLWDLPNDRRHWSKRYRPLANGQVSIKLAVLFAFLSILTGFLLASSIGESAVQILTLYIFLTLSYSFFLKRIPIFDVLTLASLFTLRLGFGVVLASVQLSSWLLVFSMFVFLSLSMAKRHTEVLRITELNQEYISGRDYQSNDAPLTLGIGLASMLGSILIMVLYLIEDAFPSGIYAYPQLLWTIPSILFLFLGRVWILSQRGKMHDDPVVFAIKDPISIFLGLLMLSSVIVAMIGSSYL